VRISYPPEGYARRCTTLLEKAAEVIKALNVKYEGLGRAPFFLLHRDGSDQLGPMLDRGPYDAKAEQANSFIVHAIINCGIYVK